MMTSLRTVAVLFYISASTILLLCSCEESDTTEIYKYTPWRRKLNPGETGHTVYEVFQHIGDAFRDLGRDIRDHYMEWKGKPFVRWDVHRKIIRKNEKKDENPEESGESGDVRQSFVDPQDGNEWEMNNQNEGYAAVMTDVPVFFDDQEEPSLV